MKKITLLMAVFLYATLYLTAQVTLPDAQLLVKYDFNGLTNSSTTVPDLSGNSRTGNIIGSFNPATSLFPNAFYCGLSTDHHVKTTMNAELDQLTVAFWYYHISAPNTNNTIWSPFAEVLGTPKIDIANGVFRCGMKKTEAGQWAVSDADYTPATITNKWIHIAATFDLDGLLLKWYINGVKESQTAITGETKASYPNKIYINTYMTIGAWYNASSALVRETESYVDDFHMYSTVLTDEQIALLANPTNFQSNTVPVNSGVKNAADIPCTTCGVSVASGAELTVGANKTLKSVTVAAGGKLTISAGELTATNGVTLESDATGTATILNSGTLTGTVNAKQYLGSARNWYVSSPVSSAGAPTTNMDYYYEYMEGGTNTSRVGQPGSPDDYWKGIANNTTMEVGKGYIAKANAGGTIQFSGTPNNGDITTTFDLTRNDAKGKGFNLVGNPYPSYIDWTDVAAANPNLENTYYYRTKNTNVTNTYTFVTWNGAGSSYVVSNGSLPVNTSITSSIPPTQAFWVRVKSETATTKMYFNNGMREHRLDNNNLMKAPKQDTRTSLRLQLQNGADSDEMLVYLDSEASNNYDAYDSPKMMNNSVSVPDLYSKVGEEQLVINGLHSFTNNTELPLGFGLKAASTLKFKLSELTNLPEKIKVYLRDKQENKETELNHESEYTFSTTEATTNNESRFSLLFRAPGVTTDINNSTKVNAQVFVNVNNQITIIAPEKASYNIYNAMGQLIENGKLNAKHETINSKLNAGVYFVNLSVNSQNEIQKVIIR